MLQNLERLPKNLMVYNVVSKTCINNSQTFIFKPVYLKVDFSGNLEFIP